MTDKELIAAMRDLSAGPSSYLQDMGNAAADRIETLLREKAAAYAQGYGDCEAEISLTEIGRTNEFLHGQIAKWKARAEQLVATNEALVKREEKLGVLLSAAGSVADIQKQRAERLEALLDRAVNGPWLDGDLERARAALTQKEPEDD